MDRSARSPGRRQRTLPPEIEADGRNDRQLVNAARAGDERAFDVLFYRYRDGIYRLALAITKDRLSAEEVVVDTFARAYRTLARLEPEDTLRPWLYRVAINESYDRRPRKGLVTGPLDDMVEQTVASDDRSPSVLAEMAETRRAVLECVDALGKKHRDVVVLHYLNGLALGEIAVILACPVGTVKSRLFYALRRLRTHLAQHPVLLIEPIEDKAATGE